MVVVVLEVDVLLSRDESLVIELLDIDVDNGCDEFSISDGGERGVVVVEVEVVVFIGETGDIGKDMV
ncbi:Uncharacterised protein [Chlamydia trachomatis]|nr:Uncharacterised protein [Chlamydia trachomatis]